MEGLEGGVSKGSLLLRLYALACMFVGLWCTGTGIWVGAGVGNTSTSTTGLSIVDCTIGNNSAGHGGAQLYFSSVADVLVASSSWDMTANNTQVRATGHTSFAIASAHGSDVGEAGSGSAFLLQIAECHASSPQLL